MQIAQENATGTTALGVVIPESSTGGRSPYADYKIIRRNGAVVAVEPSKIAVVGALIRRQPQGGTFHIEDIQDQVELALMRSGQHDVARAYVLYREERSKARTQEKSAKSNEIQVVDGGSRKPLDRQALAKLV